MATTIKVANWRSVRQTPIPNLVYMGSVSASISRIGNTDEASITINAEMGDVNGNSYGDPSTYKCFYKIDNGSYSSFNLTQYNAAGRRYGMVQFRHTVADSATPLTLYIYFDALLGSYHEYSKTGHADLTYSQRKASPSPSGLTYARNGLKLEFSWKIPNAKYGNGQQLQYRINRDGKWLQWNDLTASATSTKNTFTIALNNYYPNTNNLLCGLETRVRGKTTSTSKVVYLWSAWVSKVYDFLIPNVPSLSASLSGSLSNVTTFTWNEKVETNNQKFYTDVQWQSILVKNCNETDGSKLAWKTSTLGWQTGTSTNANTSKTITEDSTLLAGGSYTRWFRVRGRGVQGASAWRYAKHVYAKPNRASVKDAVIKNTVSGGYYAKVTWVASATASHPIDETTVQYKMVVPAENLTCPSGETGWKEANVSADTGGTDAASFAIDDRLSEDECLFVRVNTTHDRDTTTGIATLALIGELSDPEDVSVSLNTSTYVATVTATNTSDVPDSFLAVVYRRKKQPNKDYVVGIIPHGSTSVACHLPNWTSDPNFAFGIYACVGSYTRKTRQDGTDAYAVTRRMVSANTVWTQGDVPQAPTGVTVTAVDGIPDTVRVTWNWTWSSADSAELSWSDHEDAWESTDEPSSYVVENTDATAWNIAGLTAGKRWYIAVRLISEGVKSAWSRRKVIDLSSAPVKPNLVLSASTIRLKDSFTAYWSYVTTDNTPQSYAKICEATINNGVITYGRIIAHTETAQHITLNRKKKWSVSQTYLLCVKVTSASGHESEWSDPVAITVADPIDCEITETSIVDTVIERDAETLAEASVLNFESDGAKEFAELTCHIEPKQSGSGTPSPTNIRPISGYEEVVLSECGVNVWDEEWELGSLNASGEKTSSSTEIRSKNKIKILPSTSYSACFGAGAMNLICFYDASENHLSNTFVGTSGNSFTTPADAMYMMFKMSYVYGTTYNNDISVNYPNTVTTYSPYNGTTTTIQLGQTVYGGTLDVVSGELTITDGIIASYNGETLPSTWISDRDVYAQGTTPTTGAQVCYKLATPTSVQLSPQQIGTLTGINNVWANAGDLDGRIAYIRNVTALTEMPFTVTVEGAGAGGTTSVIVERAEDYHVDRPNESTFHGYEGETIVIYSQTGESQITITNDMLLGLLDDGASYRLIATSKDGYGQTDSETIDFEVHWEHQAIEPSAEVALQGSAALISPIAPTGAIASDVCDIYRLSADKPVLVYEGAEFGQTYVDPYPAIGQNGGHRCVLRTENGDYITEDDSFAWVDIEDGFDADYSIIDFDGNQILLRYDLSLNHSWQKDFKETKYLGGSIQGDWNPSVGRSLDMSAVSVTLHDDETISLMRRLAVYAGICHVRTPDGSSFSADIQVTEQRSFQTSGRRVDFSLKITRIDPEGLDGLPVEVWEA